MIGNLTSVPAASPPYLSQQGRHHLLLPLPSVPKPNPPTYPTAGAGNTSTAGSSRSLATTWPHSKLTRCPGAAKPEETELWIHGERWEKKLAGPRLR